MRTALVVVMLLAGSVAVRAEDKLSAKVLARMKAATVYLKVQAGNGVATGSGFLLHAREGAGYVVSNAHVVAPEGVVGRVSCVLFSGTARQSVLPATVVALDASADLAILRITEKQLPTPLDVSKGTEPQETQSVYAFGFPYGELLRTGKRGPAITVSRGSVSSLRRTDDEVLSLVQITGGIDPGNSGGPVVDAEGNLIGVAVAKVRNSEIGFAIPVGTVQRMLDGRVSRVNVSEATTSGRSVRLEFEVMLLDPLERIRSVDVLMMPKSRVRETGRDDDGEWKAISRFGARKLAIENGRASGQVAISKPRAGAGDYYFQIRVGFGGNRYRYAQPTPFDVIAALENGSGAPGGAGDSKIVSRRAEGTASASRTSPTGSYAPPEFDAPKSSSNRVEVPLTAGLRDVVVAGGGRYLLLQAASEDRVDVFDVSKLEVARSITIPPRAIVTGGAEVVVAVTPTDGRMHVWSLSNGRRRESGALRIEGVVKTAAMGAASKGPVLLHMATAAAPLAKGFFVLVDPATLKPIRLKELTGDHGSRQMIAILGRDGSFPLWHTTYRDRVNVRAAANGSVFTAWTSAQSPMGLHVLRLTGTSGHSIYRHETVGHVLPTPDGENVCTATGVRLGAKLLPDGERVATIPTVDPRYVAKVPTLAFPPRPRSLGTPTKPAIVDVKTGRDVAELPALGELVQFPPPRADQAAMRLANEKRVHVLPKHGVVISIPVGNERLVVQRFTPPK